MSADAWLVEHGIDPDSVSDNLKALLSLCDDPKNAAMLLLAISVTEVGDD